MNDAIDVILAENRANRLLVADVCLYKCIVGQVLNVLQVLKISRIGQLVHVDDTDRIPVFLQHVMDKIGTDKARTAGYKKCFHDYMFSL